MMLRQGTLTFMAAAKRQHAFLNTSARFFCSAKSAPLMAAEEATTEETEE